MAKHRHNKSCFHLNQNQESELMSPQGHFDCGVKVVVKEPRLFALDLVDMGNLVRRP
jgi:hypothetical protein